MTQSGGGRSAGPGRAERGGGESTARGREEGSAATIRTEDLRKTYKTSRGDVPAVRGTVIFGYLGARTFTRRVLN